MIDPMDHQGFVYLKVRRYARRGMEKEDLVQEANLALIRACKHFDPAMGIKFVSYSGRSIDRQLRRALEDQVPIIRVPSTTLMYHRRVGPAAKSTTQRECVAVADIVARARRKDLDLADQVGLDEGPEADLIRAEELAALATTLSRLPPRSREVLARRYGLGGRPRETLHAIGRDLGITKESVRRIQDRALARIRKALQGGE